MGNIVKKCDKCNKYYVACSENSVIDNNTENCGGNLIDTGLVFDEWLIINNISDNTFLDAMIQLKKDDIIEYNLKMSQFKSQMEQQEAEKNKIICPRCGSTNITTGQRGFKLTTGFIGSNKTVNRCGNCGYSWKP